MFIDPVWSFSPVGPNFATIHLTLRRVFPRRLSGFGHPAARTHGCQRGWSPRRGRRSWTRRLTRDRKADIRARGAVERRKGHGYGATVQTRWGSSWLPWLCEFSRVYITIIRMRLVARFLLERRQQCGPYSTPLWWSKVRNNKTEK